jgi:hypothetical protein
MRFTPIIITLFSSLVLATVTPQAELTGGDRDLSDPNSIAHHKRWEDHHNALMVQNGAKGDIEEMTKNQIIADHHDWRAKMAQDLLDHQDRVNKDPFHVSTRTLKVPITHPLAQEYYNTWADRNAARAQMHGITYAMTKGFAEAGINPNKNELLAQRHLRASILNQEHADNNQGWAFLAKNELDLARARRAGALGPQAGAPARAGWYAGGHAAQH